MSSVGFSSNLPSVADFMANQGTFIDTHILMAVVGAANAETVSRSIAAQAARLAGLMSRGESLAQFQAELGGLSNKIAKPEIDQVDAKTAEWSADRQKHPIPAIGKTPNLATWDDTHPLTYSDDADAKYLKDRGLPVAVYVPAQTKVVQVPNPAHTALQKELADLKAQFAAETDPVKKAALAVQIALKEQELANTPATISKTLFAPQIGTPDAYNQNTATIAAYKESLEDGTADNPVIDELTTNSADLKNLEDELAAEGVAKPTKFKDISGSVGSLTLIDGGFAQTIAQARSDLFALVDRAGAAFDFLNDLAAELGKSGQKEIDKLQKRVSSALEGVDLRALDPQTRAAAEDALAQLASVTPEGDFQAILQTLPADRKREALQQISTFQKELEALRGTAAPPTSTPSFQTSSRLVRV
jgi:hypothetical protein